MCRRTIRTLLLIDITVAMCGVKVACAQGVSVIIDQGVHVHAPFVSVDVFPDGGVSVRAPHAAIDVGGRPYEVRRNGEADMAIPSPRVLAALDDESLWRVLRNHSFRLNQRLRRFDTGSSWQRYLRLPDELVAGAHVSDENRYAAAAIVEERFAKVAADARYRRIAGLAAFQSMQMVLAEISDRSRDAGLESGTSVEDLPPPRPPAAARERSVVVPPQ